MVEIDKLIDNAKYLIEKYNIFKKKKTVFKYYKKNNIFYEKYSNNYSKIIGLGVSCVLAFILSLSL